jgi:hypothetical protein
MTATPTAWCITGRIRTDVEDGLGFDEESFRPEKFGTDSTAPMRGRLAFLDILGESM